MNILQINASARGADSNSTELANAVVKHLQATNPTAHLDVQDLGQNPHPTLDGDALAALFTPGDQRSAEQKTRVAIDDALIAQVQAADVLVLGVPMYNFGIPAQLKSWFDAIARAGVTFRYTENGPEGLLKGKKVYVTLARGGIYRDTPNDSQVPYLKTILGFLGMSDIEWVYAEGLAMGAEVAEKAMREAHAQIEGLFANAETESA
ncbi:MAG: NAD(P)H-dependent oxidoreductase [Burkholderiaceae bacterium]|nr:NAD(P)H-dependent oxidoreductase [Burkholderiaceae bacterium]MCD8518167.1 NAD(P)H-dependent oxidoreductase [Burkholderiaceae bacterium]MCD8537752.1 NAD(P)H-dependent oxidoreductase [Burkholderiaceae bacterium]MCD8564171.1 NAD(P)H-dependent oxidoreductase [Burkholderiaceae bacterium]